MLGAVQMNEIIFNKVSLLRGAQGTRRVNSNT